MAKYVDLKNKTDMATTVREFLGRILVDIPADGILVSARTPYSVLPMPTLFSDGNKMDLIEPLAPVAPFNSARQAASLLRNDIGKKLVLVLRPCEIRALVELTKLNQCVIENALIIGIECLGRLENKVYLDQAENLENLTEEFYRGEELQDSVCRTCRTCENFHPVGADLVIDVVSDSENKRVGIAADTSKGEAILDQLKMEMVDVAKTCRQKADKILAKRTVEKEKLFDETLEKLKSIEEFQKLVSNCLNCYNCRVACPVCYCRECVFVTDVFSHDPEVFLRRAQKKGSVKMPTETSMFHLTRLAHIGHACVGCGHCSSVCPSEIPVADIFKTVSAKVQDVYSYVPGRDPEEKIPYLLFEAAN